MDINYPSNYDLYLFHEGTNFHSYKMLGAHCSELNGINGVRFAVWAPNANEVRLVGDFNDWQGHNHVMQESKASSGVWVIFIYEIQEGEIYKYEIHTKQGEVFLKADPFAYYSEFRPRTASKICSLEGYQWKDESWQQHKQSISIYQEPLLIYEVNLGSWKKKQDKNYLSYRDLAKELVEYVADLGYSHIELLPLMEFPYDRSWGYQSTGYYSVTSRYGTPKDFMYFIDRCHEKGLGVILDWVPGHFCKDAHGLRRFDGTTLYEYQDPQKAERPEWGTLSFDLGKPEVISFLISNAVFWMDVYHIDGLRVDAVASMLYLDYGKKGGEWTANDYGGNDNLEAIAFLRKLNEVIFHYFPKALMIAEESTTWPLVSAPTYFGGLGFNFKWNMGWMNDTLRYMELDPIYRKYHHNLLTFSFFYAFSENFVLPFSHDEVVHGKKSLLNKMPGDYWQKFANLRVLYGYMMAHPGKKLMFMGGEFGQFDEWKDEEELDWNLFEFQMHQKTHAYIRELNCFYRQAKAFWELDHSLKGFQWIDPHDYNQSVVSFMRIAENPLDFLIVICNFTPQVYVNYRIGVPSEGVYREVFNSDLERFGGSGQTNTDQLRAEGTHWHNQPFSLTVKVPPLAFIIVRLLDEITDGKE